MNLVLLVGVGFFLLVVGTLLGRYYVPDRRPLQRAAQEGRSYIRGLVEVLQGDDDAAIKEIADALKRNTKTVDAYFALGTLFRNRGEYERAVRVHQSILVRRDIDKKTRLRTHHQLALDFQAAGFPRRAIKALEWVLSRDKKQLSALQELAGLYEQTGQWERAVLAHRKVAKIGKKDTSRLQAHMLAELASQALEQGAGQTARRHIKRALAIRPDSVHALHVMARYQLQRKNLDAAVRAWERALRLAPDLASFFVPRLEMVLFEREQLQQLERLLQQLLEQNPGHIQLRLASTRFDARRNPERALVALTELLEEAPTLIPARREAAKLVLATGDPDRIRSVLQDLIALLARADRGYRCGECGDTSGELFWRCNRCHAWDSVRVAWGRRGGEGDREAR